MRSRLGDLGRLALVSVVAATFIATFVLVYWFSVRTVTGREFGDAALRGAILTQEPVSDTVDRVLDVVSAASLTGSLAVVATIALLRLARITGLVAIGVMVAANGTTWLLKEHLLTRPDLGLDEYTPATLNSLPSGHSTAVFSAVAAVLLVLPQRMRLPVAAAGGVFSVLTALATMSAGWHRPGDSVAAFLVVGFWLAVAATGRLLLAGTPEADTDARSERAKWFGPITLGAITLGLTLVLALDAAAGFRDSAVGRTFALLTGALLVAGTAAGVLYVMLRVLEVVEAAPDAGTAD